MSVNEYYCNECNTQIKIVLEGVNNKFVNCPFCKSEDVNWMDAKEEE